MLNSLPSNAFERDVSSIAVLALAHLDESRGAVNVGPLQIESLGATQAGVRKELGGWQE